MKKVPGADGIKNLMEKANRRWTALMTSKEKWTEEPGSVPTLISHGSIFT